MNDVRGPSVSVVVVSHNYGRFLDDALQSVVGQSRAPDEVVVIDDASTDATPHVAARWSADVPYVESVRNETRLGPARTFNRGFARATGDLVVKLDGDDRFSGGYLEALEAAILRTGADIAYSGVRQFGAQTRQIPATPFDRRELMRENFINGSAMMKRSVWERTGGFREELDGLGLEDWELFVNAVSLGMNAVPVESCWLEYRRHVGGSRNTVSHLDAFRAHWLVRRMHPDAVALEDVGAWMARSVRRNLVGASTRGS
jgi:glycosyltransferase involved in cell wall biosynthesis